MMTVNMPCQNHPQNANWHGSYFHPSSQHRLQSSNFIVDSDWSYFHQSQANHNIVTQSNASFLSIISWWVSSMPECVIITVLDYVVIQWILSEFCMKFDYWPDLRLIMKWAWCQSLHAMHWQITFFSSFQISTTSEPTLTNFMHHA